MKQLLSTCQGSDGACLARVPEVHLVYSISWVAQMLGQALYSWDFTWQEMPHSYEEQSMAQTREGVGTRQLLWMV